MYWRWYIVCQERGLMAHCCAARYQHGGALRLSVTAAAVKDCSGNARRKSRGETLEMIYGILMGILPVGATRVLFVDDGLTLFRAADC